MKRLYSSSSSTTTNLFETIFKPSSQILILQSSSSSSSSSHNLKQNIETSSVDSDNNSIVEKLALLVDLLESRRRKVLSNAFFNKHVVKSKTSSNKYLQFCLDIK